MKKRWVLFNTMVIVIVFMAISLFFQKRQGPDSQGSKPPSAGGASSESLIKSTLEKPLPGYDLENYVPLTEKSSLTCPEFLDHVRGSLFSQMFEEVLHNPAAIPENCAGTEGPLREIIFEKLQSCRALPPKTSSKSPSDSPASIQAQKDECATALMLIKTSLLLEGVRRDDLNSMTFSQLIARAMEILSVRPVDMNQFGQVLHELDSRESNQASLKKGLAVYYGFQYENAEGEARQKAYENLKYYLNAATQLNPDDWESYELRLYYLMQEDRDQARMLADRLRVQYPQLGLGPYYLAYVEWKNQNRDQALHYAKEAHQREPQVPRYADTFNKIPAASFEDKIFTIRINITPEL